MKYIHNCQKWVLDADDIAALKAGYSANKECECPICKTKLGKDNKVWSTICGINLNGVDNGVSTFKGAC